VGTESQSLNSLQKMEDEQSAYFFYLFALHLAQLFSFVLFCFSRRVTQIWPDLFVYFFYLSLTSRGPLRELFLTELDCRNPNTKHHGLDSGPLLYIYIFCSMVMRVAQLIFIMNLLFLAYPLHSLSHQKSSQVEGMSRPTPRLHKKRKVHVRPGR
jgi:hypothetical protein